MVLKGGGLLMKEIVIVYNPASGNIGRRRRLLDLRKCKKFLRAGNYKYKIIKNKMSICIFGCLCGYLYGLIVNLWTVLSYGSPIKKEAVIATYTLSIPFDTIHAVSTVIFLYILAMPMKEKMERLKMKYGLYR